MASEAGGHLSWNKWFSLPQEEKDKYSDSTLMDPIIIYQPPTKKKIWELIHDILQINEWTSVDSIADILHISKRAVLSRIKYIHDKDKFDLQSKKFKNNVRMYRLVRKPGVKYG